MNAHCKSIDGQCFVLMSRTDSWFKELWYRSPLWSSREYRASNAVFRVCGVCCYRLPLYIRWSARHKPAVSFGNMAFGVQPPQRSELRNGLCCMQAV